MSQIDFNELTVDQLHYVADIKQRLRDLNALAEPRIDVNNITLVRLYRTLFEMFRRAGVFSNENNFEEAYKLYLRFSIIVLQVLPKHPYFREQGDVQTIRQLNEKATKSIKASEQLKDLIRRRYDIDAKRANDELRIIEIATIKAKHEKEKRELEAAEIASLSERHKSETNARNALMASMDPLHNQNRIPDQLPPASGEHAAPAILFQRQEDAHKSINTDLTNFNSARADYPSATPTGFNSVSLVPSPHSGDIPSFDRNTKPKSSNQMVPTISGLGRVEIPADIVDQFMRSAATNTSCGIETCGVLCGKMHNGQYFISHCLIPKQNGGPDSCDTLHEHLIFEYQEENDLLTLGWIHTHPTQTAFLSSVDLHTHYSYQALLPEAIAIVIAPKYEETGIFRLNEIGMRNIGACRMSGFHPHDSCFETCAHTGYDHSMSIVIKDFR